MVGIFTKITLCLSEKRKTMPPPPQRYNFIAFYECRVAIFKFTTIHQVIKIFIQPTLAVLRRSLLQVARFLSAAWRLDNTAPKKHGNVDKPLTTLCPI